MRKDQTSNTRWRFKAIIDFTIQVERVVSMATSPSLPTYGIACSHNMSSLFKEIYMFTQLPLRTHFLSFRPDVSNNLLCVWLVKSTPKPFPTHHGVYGTAVAAAQGTPTCLPTLRKGHHSHAGADAAPKLFQMNHVRKLPIVLLPGTPVKPHSFCTNTTWGKKCPPIFPNCAMLNLALVGDKFTFTFTVFPLQSVQH